MRLYRPIWKSKDGEKRKSSRWWIDFADGNARRWRLPGLTDKRQTETLARNVERLLTVRASGDALPADLLKWLEQVPADFRQRLADAGLIDADRVGGVVPLLTLDDSGQVTGGHLADFMADAKARGVSKTQLLMLGQRVRDVLTRARAKWIRDLSAARIQAAIASFGEPTENRPEGLSKQSLQHYAKAAKQFSRWLYRERRTAEDVLLGLKGYNVETDKRRERRGFTSEEMAALLAWTRQAPTRWGMSGPTRAASYALAFASGLRRNEILTLTRASFDLDADPPTVTVEAGYSKHRRKDIQPLPADVADMLAGYLADADPERPFPLPGKTGKMLREDMAEARQTTRQGDADFLTPRDSRGLVLDFHSFRHGYVTAICRANVSPRVMMALARHSDPRLTMKRYSRVGVQDTARALDALPKLSGGPDERQELRATGTDYVTSAQDARLKPPGQAPGGFPARQIGNLPNDRPNTALRSEAVQNVPETPSQRFAKSFAKPCRFSRSTANLGERKGEKADVGKILAGKGNNAIIKAESSRARVAQLDRASVYGTEGYWFESSRA
jgi:integrase